MDHADLIKELPQIERMTNQERLKLAHNRRKLQLKTWAQQEKLWAAGTVPSLPVKGGKGHHGTKGHHPVAAEPEPQKKVDKVKEKMRIRFRNSIMLLEAAGRNDVEEVKKLLESGVDADVANEDGLTALHQCCIDDNEELLKLLLEFGANVNSEDSERWTPLHAAATCGHRHLVTHLITKGANLLAVNAEGNMPYDICDEEATLDYIESEMAKRGVTQELIEEIRALPETKMLQDMQILQAEGGCLTEADSDGATFLHIASANGYIRVVEFLLDNHVSIIAQDKDCWQPIHAAACWGHIDVLELLVQSGADLNARTKNNETPYAICEDPEMKERIIQLRSEMETKLREGGVRKIRRSQSSNSRTQSIRRTSQRDKGLTTKRDVADEAQMLLTIAQINNKDNSSPSPTSDVGSVASLQTSEPPHPTEPSSRSGSEEDIDIKSFPPGFALGRDSIFQLLQEKTNYPPKPVVHPTRSKFLTHNNNSIHNNPALTPPVYTNPITNGHALDRTSTTDLPVPDVNPIVEVQPNKGVVSTGTGGAKDSSSRDSSSSANNTIDIHVQVTINTNGSNTNSPTFSGQNNNTTALSSSYTPPGTLADLKKQRSLQYTSHNRSNSIISNGYILEPPPKYEARPPSPTNSLRRFSGNPGDIVGDYSSSGKKCCTIV